MSTRNEEMERLKDLRPDLWGMVETERMTLKKALELAGIRRDERTPITLVRHIRNNYGMTMADDAVIMLYSPQQLRELADRAEKEMNEPVRSVS